MPGLRAYRKGITLQIEGTLIQFKVDIHSAVEKDASNHTVCTGGGTHVATQVKQSLACPECGNKDRTSFQLVAANDDGAGVLLSPEERKQVKEEAVAGTDKTVALSFCPAEDVHRQTIPNGSTYFLTAVGGSEVVIDHIRDAMNRHPELSVVGTYSPAGVPNHYEFRLFGETLLMTQIASPQAVKVVEQPIGTLYQEAQQQMDAIVKQVAKPFDADAYRNTLKDRMAELVASREATDLVLTKASGGKATVAPVIDFGAMLAGSLKAETKKPAAKKRTAAKQKAA